MSNPLCICGDCNALFYERECGERIHAEYSEAWGAVACTTTRNKTCPYCASEEVGEPTVDDVFTQLCDMKRERDQALHAMAQAQGEAGASETAARGFQIECRLLEARCKALEARLMAHREVTA